MSKLQVKMVANAFWLAAARNFEKRRLNTEQFQVLIVPAVVCCAFSIELGIKAMLLPNPPKTHNLAKLFKQLSKEIQDQIVANCVSKGNCFDKSISSVADVFEKWRYIYESESSEIDLVFLQSLSDAVKIAVDTNDQALATESL